MIEIKCLPSHSSPALISNLLMPDLPEPQAVQTFYAMLATAGMITWDYNGFGSSALLEVQLRRVQ